MTTSHATCSTTLSTRILETIAPSMCTLLMYLLFNCILTGHHHETTIKNNTSDANDICDGDILVLRSISKVEAATCLHACCGAIIKLNAKGSGRSGLDVVGLPEVFIESFRLLRHDAKQFRACHDSGRIIM